VDARNGEETGFEESWRESGCSVVLTTTQMVQKVEATLNKFKQTHLVRRKVGRHTEWRGSRIGGELEGEWVQRCVDKGSDSSES